MGLRAVAAVAAFAVLMAPMVAAALLAMKVRRITAFSQAMFALSYC
jgi:hypothetical protein